MSLNTPTVAGVRRTTDGHVHSAKVSDELATVLFALDTASLTTSAVTARITRTIVAWAVAHGWSVRNEARVDVAARTGRQRGYMDIVIRRDGQAQDIAIEIDSAAKPWSLDKLRHAASAGMHAIWIRWGDEIWAGAYDDVDVIQLPQTRKPGSRAGTNLQQPLWPDRARF